MTVWLSAETSIVRNEDKIKEKSEIFVLSKSYCIITCLPELMITCNIFFVLLKKDSIGCNFHSFIIFLLHVKCV
jgi:hypothetical protein